MPGTVLPGLSADRRSCCTWEEDGICQDAVRILGHFGLSASGLALQVHFNGFRV